MLRAIVGTGLVVLGCGVAFGQTETLPSFEVASVKPAAPQEMGRIMVRMSGGPGTPDPGQMTFTNVSLKQLIQSAYDVKGYQISGPDWLDSVRFDISAKVPKDTTKEQFRLMQQSLLAERFKLSLHHQTKDLPMYGLVVAKGGVKMKETVEEPASTDGGPKESGGPGAPPPPPPPGGAAFGGGRLPIGKDGFPQLPKGAGRGGAMMMVMNGRMRLQASGQPMSRLVDMLANQLDRPVVDLTELQGKYDYILDFAPDENQRGMMKGAMAGMPPPGMGDGGGPGRGGPDGEAGPSLFAAVQEQLGLKLDARKGPVDLLVIDRMEKVPTEN